MSREYPDYEILEICCAGPKQYALKLQHKTKGQVSYAMKIRGITLDKRNEGKMSYEKFKEIVMKRYGEESGEAENPFFDYNRLGADKASHMFTRTISKIYRPVNTKGYAKNGIIYPFGYE